MIVAMRMEPVDSGAKKEWRPTALPTEKQSISVLMNSITSGVVLRSVPLASPDSVRGCDAEQEPGSEAIKERGSETYLHMFSEASPPQRTDMRPTAGLRGSIADAAGGDGATTHRELDGQVYQELLAGALVVATSRTTAQGAKSSCAHRRVRS